MRGGKSAAEMSHDTMTNSALLKDIGISLIGISTSSSCVKDILLLPQWFSLTDVKSGRVHLILEWVPTASDSENLDQVSHPRYIFHICSR